MTTSYGNHSQVIDEEVNAQEGPLATGWRAAGRQRGARGQAESGRGSASQAPRREEQVLVGRELRRGGGHSRDGGKRLHKVRRRGEYRSVLYILSFSFISFAPVYIHIYLAFLKETASEGF